MAPWCGQYSHAVMVIAPLSVSWPLVDLAILSQHSLHYMQFLDTYTELAKLTNHIDAFSDEGITAKMHDAALPDTCSETVNCKKTGLKNLFFLFLKLVTGRASVHNTFKAFCRPWQAGFDQQTAFSVWKCDYHISFASDLYYDPLSLLALPTQYAEQGLCNGRCPFVSPSMGLQQQSCSSGFAAVSPADRRCRSVAAAVAGKCWQCHVVSVCWWLTVGTK